MRNCFQFALVSFLLLFAKESMGANDNHPFVFYVVDYPPYIITHTNGHIDGIDVEVIREAFASVHQAVEFKVLPWNRILKLMKVGDIIGTVSCSKRESRMAYMLFSDVISSSRQAVITLEDMNTHFIRKLNDLKMYSVVAVNGWGVQSQLEKRHIPHVLTRDLSTGLVNIVYRGIDGFYGPEKPIFYQAHRMGLLNQIKSTYLMDVPPLKLHLCVSKKYPDSQSIIKKFNEGFALIKKNGRYQQIRVDYFKPSRRGYSH